MLIQPTYKVYCAVVGDRGKTLKVHFTSHTKNTFQNGKASNNWLAHLRELTSVWDVYWIILLVPSNKS